MNTKNELRLWAKNKRKDINIENISKILVEKLKQTKEYQEAKNVMIFYPKTNEVDLLSLLEDESKKFYLPKIDKENLLCCFYKKGDELCKSCFKTMEPLTEPVSSGNIDLIIVPALAVDKNKYRLGYGGGYYDRFLKDVNCTKCVCISKELVLDTVLAQEHDIKMDIIVTE